MPRFVLTLLVLACGCRRVPESVLLRIEGTASPAAFLRLSVYDGTGAVVRDRPLGAAATPLSLPASVVLYPPAGSGPLRIDVRAILGTAVEAEGTATITPRPDEQIAAQVVLEPGARPDLDGDGVPDVIDTCHEIPNPDQRPGGCPARDGGPDRARDAATDAPADAASDRPQDQRALDGKPRDQRSPDQRPPDLRRPDLRKPDLRPPDTKPPAPDLPVYQPITTAALAAAFAAATVPCINAQGVVAGNPISIVDQPTVSFQAPVLASAPAATLTWLQGKPALVVVWDPNACDALELPSGGSNWATAGLLIRGATLDAFGRLQLQTGVTLSDIDMIDIDVAGVINDDFFQPDDSTLSSFPQLVQPVQVAKQLVLKLATP